GNFGRLSQGFASGAAIWPNEFFTRHRSRFADRFATANWSTLFCSAHYHRWGHFGHGKYDSCDYSSAYLTDFDVWGGEGGGRGIIKHQKPSKHPSLSSLS